jgi:hypothetical protein
MIGNAVDTPGFVGASTIRILSDERFLLYI